MRTASVELLEVRAYLCQVCPPNAKVPPAWALYNVFDGQGTLYACGRHLTRAIELVATVKGQ